MYVVLVGTICVAICVIVIFIVPNPILKVHFHFHTDINSDEKYAKQIHSSEKKVDFFLKQWNKGISNNIDHLFNLEKLVSFFCSFCNFSMAVSTVTAIAYIK